MAASVQGAAAQGNPFDDLVWPADSTCKARTGYSTDQLYSHFEEYKLELFDAVTPLPGYARATEEMKRFYLIFVYIHLHPLTQNFSAVLRIAGEGGGANKYWYDRYCRPIAWKLGQVMREIHPEDRFNLMNHCPFFSDRITEIIDTLPVRIACSLNSMINNISYNPKYAACIIKLTIACTFTGIPTKFAINLGIQHDGRIAFEEEGLSWEERLEWEWSMADGPYESLPRCFLKHRPQAIPGTNPIQYAPLTQNQLADNWLIEFYRGRIEHINAQFVAHDLFNGRRFRGTYQDLVAYINITMHATTAQIRDFEPTRQREGFGPFPHPPSALRSQNGCCPSFAGVEPGVHQDTARTPPGSYQSGTN